MLTSIALIFLLGLLFSAGFQKLKLPGLLGMIIAGMILSPHALNLLDPSILAVAEDGSMTGIAGDLRQLALVVILSRAGLALDLTDLKKVGRPAVMMCFVPACFEMVGVLLLAPALLHVTVLEAAVMGSVLAAVSPAVVVPRMLKLMEEGYGKEHSIPQLILAGASVDDVFVIVMFTAFTALAGGGKVSALSFLQIPVSVVLGILLGALVGMALVWFFDTFTSRDTVKLLITLSASFLMLALQNVLEGMVPVSGLLGIMSMGIWIRRSRPGLANLLSGGYNQLWVAAEVLLFVLVGATVDLAYVRTAGVMAVLSLRAMGAL